MLRCAIVKQIHPFSYQKLAFHLADSQSFRAFGRLPYGFTPVKRVFGLSRCLWKGWPHFQRYVHLSVLSSNRLVLARLLL